MPGATQRPNILFVMADQMSALATSPYGNHDVLTPHLQSLADRGVVFEQYYCNYPICVPSRMAMLTGRLPVNIESYDNGCELPASVPTFLHHLRLAGYRTLLSGKMHFVGPDQLHGFERRLTTDIYPANYNLYRPWPNRDMPPTPANLNMVRPLKHAGPVPWTHQMDYDEEVHFRALEQLRAFGQGREFADGPPRDPDQPWFFCVSYTQPHDPTLVTQEYWDRYEGGEIAMPAAPPAGFEPHLSDVWVNRAIGVDVMDLQPEDVYRSRRAYYAMTSYIDDKLGELLRELDRWQMREHTVVVFTSDHGDMCGEHGMWYKRSVREWSARVPLIAAGPGLPAGHRFSPAASHVDLYPSLLSLAGVDLPADVPLELDGHDFLPHLQTGARSHASAVTSAAAGGAPTVADAAWPDEAIVENYGSGTLRPVRAIVHDGWKYVHVNDLPPQLYDLRSDPDEWYNLAGRPEHADREAALRTRLFEGWDPVDVERRIVASQRVRDLVKRALDVGLDHPWDYQPLFDASRVYSRGNRAHRASAARAVMTEVQHNSAPR
jgi:choline-sulfatase